MPDKQEKKTYRVTWENIAPPYPDYPPFAHAGQYPFEVEREGFSLVNAWWLIEAATLAYAMPGDARHGYLYAGFTEAEYLSDASTQCYLLSNDTFSILVFRGTESRRRPGQKDYRDIVADVKADANLVLVPSGGQGKVHKGFSDALDEVWADVLPKLEALESEGRPIWITGHSLGAALATLAAYRFGRARALYTFGSPRVGNPEFAADFRTPAYRFENNNDIVCKVPTPPLYQHVGELKYIDHKGGVGKELSAWETWTDQVEGRFSNLMTTLEHRDWPPALVPDGLRDHVPVLYAIHIWNAIVSG